MKGDFSFGKIMRYQNKQRKDISVINIKYVFYSMIAKTLVCFCKVARLSDVKPVRGLEDDQAEMFETIGQYLQLLGTSIFDVNFIVTYYEKHQFTKQSKI